MKKKLLTILIGSAFVMGLAACGGGDDKGGGDTASDAAEIFDQNCSSCHGGNLQGGMGPNLTKVGSRYSQDEIRNIIKNGKGAMPKNVIEGDDADEVAKWLAAKK
ncbi:cytochrome c551 [Neobacillus dielmonensis]|uniref:cytochrome c551 n=1 Tax=Neobacillus dielmonensis TaxID=1347369 RepID=UPI0005A761FE|nr:cytochrome c [Neobacillus dielmonensis]